MICVTCASEIQCMRCYPNMVPSKASLEQSDSQRNQWWAETVVRLLVLGLPGLLLVLFSWVALIIEVSYGEPLALDPRLGVPLAFFGSLMILGGTRQWHRWGYIWVFLSVPIMATLWMIPSPLLENLPYDPMMAYPKLLGMIVFVFPALATFAAVNLHYRRKAEKAK